MDEIERDEFDGRIDESLRAVGARLTDARASEALRRRVMETIERGGGEGAARAGGAATDARVRRWRWAATAFGSVAAALALSTAILAVYAWRQTERAEELALAAAGRAPGQTTVRGDPAVSGQPPRYLVVTLHHEVCPRSAEMTPLFKRLPDEFAGSPAIFAVLDVSPSCADAAQAVSDRFGIDLVGLFRSKQSQFPETGIVKVIDLETKRVVYTELWPRQFEELEHYLQVAFAKK